MSVGEDIYQKLNKVVDTTFAPNKTDADTRKVR